MRVRFPYVTAVGEAPGMSGPGDEIAAAAGGRGHLRASHADREQVIGTLKAAFVQGMLTKDEFDLRVGQVFASRTYGELAAVTADLPAGLAAAQPPQPARAPGVGRVLRPAIVITVAVATVLYAAVWPVALALPTSGLDHDPHGAVALAGTATYVYFLVLLGAVVQILTNWLDGRSGRRPPRRPASGAAGQASPRPPSAGPGGQLPPAG
jgi:hypothetical protein